MDPLTLAMLAGAGQALLKGGLSAASQFGTAQDLKLTPEQQKRLRELERMQARNALGMTQGERELYRSQAMTPVQAAEREVMARFGAAQNIADIGQGTAFRQQQAMADTGQAARAQVSQAVAQRDADVAQQQAEEKARLEEQKRQAQALERQAALSLVGGVGEAAVGAAGIKAEYGLAQELYDKQIADLKGAAKVTSQGTQNMLGIGKSAEMQAVENTRATDASLGGDANRFVEGMTKSLSPNELLEMYTDPANMLGGVPPNLLLQKFIQNEQRKLLEAIYGFDTIAYEKIQKPMLEYVTPLYNHFLKKKGK